MTAYIFKLLIGAVVLYQNAIADIPDCVFEDTVNLTASTKFSNGSYLYEEVLVPPQLIAEYNYIELYEGVRKPVERHTRGCVCKIKQCVKFCCHPRANMYRISLITGYTLQCREVLNGERTYSPYVNVTLRNNSRVVMHMLDEFVVQQGIPCYSGGYMLMPHKYEEDHWELFENGTLLRTSDAKYFSRRDYCLHAYNTSEGFVLNPMNCGRSDDPPTLKLNTIIMLISAPFLYATILIYWLIPELWNLHTKCLISYLLSLAIGTTLIVLVNLQHTYYEKVVCAIIGFVAYFFITAVFFWLNVICFDLWKNLRVTQGAVQNVTKRKRFLYYSLYAWGMPALMTIVTASLQNSNLPNGLKSGIGDTHCWLKLDDWSAMIYFHGPCLLLIMFNIGIFFLTANNIYTIRKELQHFSRGDSSRRHLRTQQNN
ncbi:G-protein coupled receptor Mth2 isoform X2 [Zeugodacus cucurbitae]|nr:G-protein coupled receptor Mth2 isoform X2 [Zeugodacus cucurbitae]